MPHFFQPPTISVRESRTQQKIDDNCDEIMPDFIEPNLKFS